VALRASSGGLSRTTAFSVLVSPLASSEPPSQLLGPKHGDGTACAGPSIESHSGPPGKPLSRSPITPITTSLIMRRNRYVEGVEREETWRGCPITTRLGAWGSVVSSPSGVRSGALVENGFYAYLRSERRHLEHALQYC